MSALFIYPVRTSFNNQDIRLLKGLTRVSVYFFRSVPKWLLPIELVRQFFVTLCVLPKVSHVFISFGGYHSLIPVWLGKLMDKKVFIIIHGTDAASYPSINYGFYRKPMMRWFLNASFRGATRLLPVSRTLLTFTNRYYDQSEQGVLNHCPRLSTPYTVIPNTFDVDFWKSEKARVANNTFITVCTSANLALKGVDLMIECARRFPEFKFIVVGTSSIDKSAVPANMDIYPYVKREELKALYESAAFYVQFSISEGFTCALGEAMLTGCVPLVSNISELPMIAGSAGFVLEQRDSDKAAALLLKAVNAPDYVQRSEEAKRHIEQNFPIDVRERAFAALLD